MCRFLNIFLGARCTHCKLKSFHPSGAPGRIMAFVLDNTEKLALVDVRSRDEFRS
jgi:3-mercaptopyruvate sulfurtransferase SseA